MSDPTVDEFTSALRRSHERLAAAVTPLDDAALRGQSYDDDWSMAQVLSHLGSGAEIFTMFLDSAMRGDPAPGVEAFQPVWDAWNAKEPAAQAADALKVDAAFLDRLDALSGAERDRWHLSFFGAEQKLRDVVWMRLGEHALHTWDVVVALDHSAAVAPDAVPLLIERLDGLVEGSGKPTDEPLTVQVTTHSPERSFRLDLGPDGARLSVAAISASDRGGSLRLPAEAFVRLVYGRLDPEHTPAYEIEGLDLDTLRSVFPGL